MTTGRSDLPVLARWFTAIVTLIVAVGVVVVVFQRQTLDDPALLPGRPTPTVFADSTQIPTVVGPPSVTPTFVAEPTASPFPSTPNPVATPVSQTPTVPTVDSVPATPTFGPLAGTPVIPPLTLPPISVDPVATPTAEATAVPTPSASPGPTANLGSFDVDYPLAVPLGQPDLIKAQVRIVSAPIDFTAAEIARGYRVLDDVADVDREIRQVAVWVLPGRIALTLEPLNGRIALMPGDDGERTFTVIAGQPGFAEWPIDAIAGGRSQVRITGRRITGADPESQDLETDIDVLDIDGRSIIVEFDVVVEDELPIQASGPSPRPWWALIVGLSVLGVLAMRACVTVRVDWFDGEATPTQSTATEGSVAGEQNVGVLLSGGGMRAAGFGLGALLYLSDTDRLRNVAHIASVSGGSLLNGFLASTIHNSGVITTSDLAKFAGRIATKGAPLERVLKRAGPVAGLFILLGLAVGIAMWIKGFHWAWLVFAPVVTGASTVGFGSLVLTSATDQQVRAWIPAVTGLDELTFEELNSSVDHLITATEIQYGEHVHFSNIGFFADAPEYGRGDGGALRITEAIRASAALPVALPPVNLKMAELGLRARNARGRKYLTVFDGGVRDNLGHYFEISRGALRTPEIARHGEINGWIVVDASAPMDVSQRAARGPLRARLESAFRMVQILNRANTDKAARYAHRDFQDGSGVLTSIGDTPADICVEAIADPALSDRILAGEPVDASRRDSPSYSAEVALELLVRARSRDTLNYWAARRNGTESESTTLDGLTVATTARLVEHGYVLAMVQCYLAFDWPLVVEPELWGKPRFDKFVASGVSDTSNAKLTKQQER